MSEDVEGNRHGIQVDLNVPVSMEDEGFPVMMQPISGTERVQQPRDEVQDVKLEDRGYNRTQYLDSFELGSIIDAISRESR